MQGPERDLIDLSKSKQFQAHLTCLKKDAKLKSSVERLEAGFKLLEAQLNQKKEMLTQPFDMLKSIDLTIAMLTNVREILSIQGDDAYLDASVDKCGKTLKGVTKLSSDTAVRQLEGFMSTMQQARKNAKKRAAAKKTAA